VANSYAVFVLLLTIAHTNDITQPIKVQPSKILSAIIAILLGFFLAKAIIVGNKYIPAIKNGNANIKMVNTASKIATSFNFWHKNTPFFKRGG